MVTSERAMQIHVLHTSSPVSNAGDQAQLTGGIAIALHSAIELVHDREVQVRERGTSRGSLDVAVALYAEVPANNQQRRYVGRDVQMTVAHPRAVQDHRVVEHRAVAFCRLL